MSSPFNLGRDSQAGAGTQFSDLTSELPAATFSAPRSSLSEDDYRPVGQAGGAGRPDFAAPSSQSFPDDAKITPGTHGGTSGSGGHGIAPGHK